MTSCSRGDLVLVKFVFADEKGAKQRPGLIVSTDGYHQDRRESILMAVTSNVGRLMVGDYKIKAWREAGLLYPSIVTGIVRTIKHDMIAGKLGALPALEMRAVENQLRSILALYLPRSTRRPPTRRPNATPPRKARPITPSP
jgi:mRNA interferase MazF